MRCILSLILVSLPQFILFAAPNFADADILFRQGGAAPIVGVVKSESELEIVFEERFLNGQRKEQKVFKADIRKLIRTVDQNRLEGLRPDQPQAYFEYAEELAAHKADTVALQLSIRLYLIAAYLSDDELRKSAFLGLLGVDSSSLQKKRIRALAIKSLPDSYLRDFEDPKVQSDSNQQARNQLVTSLRALRSGDLQAANALLKNEELKANTSGLQPILTWDELYRMSLAKELSMEEIKLVIEAELYLKTDANARRSSKSRWSRVQNKRMTVETEWIRFSNVTAFDPEKCLFIDGSWQSPPSKK